MALFFGHTNLAMLAKKILEMDEPSYVCGLVVKKQEFLCMTLIRGQQPLAILCSTLREVLYFIDGVRLTDDI